MPEEAIVTETHRRVGVIQLNRPKALNALNATLKSRGRAALALAKGEVKAPSCQ